MKRKNVKGLALNAPAPKATPAPTDAQIPGGLGNDEKRGDTLEIGVEFRLDLRSEDLQILKELGAGNGGTVSKVMHTATKVVMARKVSGLKKRSARRGLTPSRSYMWRPRRRSGSASSVNCKSCTNATLQTSCPSMELS